MITYMVKIFYVCMFSFAFCASSMAMDAPGGRELRLRLIYKKPSADSSTLIISLAKAVDFNNPQIIEFIATVTPLSGGAGIPRRGLEIAPSPEDKAIFIEKMLAVCRNKASENRAATISAIRNHGVSSIEFKFSEALAIKLRDASYADFNVPSFNIACEPEIGEERGENDGKTIVAALARSINWNTLSLENLSAIINEVSFSVTRGKVPLTHDDIKMAKIDDQLVNGAIAALLDGHDHVEIKLDEAN